MAVKINKPALNLRALLAKLVSLKPAPKYEMFWFSGDGVNKDFTLPAGWVPKQVYVTGALKRLGTGEDFTLKFDGFKYTVSMAVAPAAVDVGVYAELSQ